MNRQLSLKDALISLLSLSVFLMNSACTKEPLVPLNNNADAQAFMAAVKKIRLANDEASLLAGLNEAHQKYGSLKAKDKENLSSLMDDGENVLQILAGFKLKTSVEATKVRDLLDKILNEQTLINKNKLFNHKKNNETALEQLLLQKASTVDPTVQNTVHEMISVLIRRGDNPNLLTFEPLRFVFDKANDFEIGDIFNRYQHHEGFVKSAVYAADEEILRKVYAVDSTKASIKGSFYKIIKQARKEARNNIADLTRDRIRGYFGSTWASIEPISLPTAPQILELAKTFANAANAGDAAALIDNLQLFVIDKTSAREIVINAVDSASNETLLGLFARSYFSDELYAEIKDILDLLDQADAKLAVNTISNSSYPVQILLNSTFNDADYNQVLVKALGFFSDKGANASLLRPNEFNLYVAKVSLEKLADVYDNTTTTALSAWLKVVFKDNSDFSIHAFDRMYGQVDANAKKFLRSALMAEAAKLAKIAAMSTPNDDGSDVANNATVTKFIDLLGTFDLIDDFNNDRGDNKIFTTIIEALQGADFVDTNNRVKALIKVISEKLQQETGLVDKEWSDFVEGARDIAENEGFVDKDLRVLLAIMPTVLEVNNIFAEAEDLVFDGNDGEPVKLIKLLQMVAVDQRSAWALLNKELDNKRLFGLMLSANLNGAMSDELWRLLYYLLTPAQAKAVLDAKTDHKHHLQIMFANSLDNDEFENVLYLFPYFGADGGVLAPEDFHKYVLMINSKDRSLLDNIYASTSPEKINDWIRWAFENGEDYSFSVMYNAIYDQDIKKKLRSVLIMEAIKLAKIAAMNTAAADGSEVLGNATVRKLLSLLETPWGGFDLANDLFNTSIDDQKILSAMVIALQAMDADFTDNKIKALIKAISKKIKAKTKLVGEDWNDFNSYASVFVISAILQPDGSFNQEEVDEILAIKVSKVEEILAAAKSFVEAPTNEDPDDFIAQYKEFIRVDHHLVGGKVTELLNANNQQLVQLLLSSISNKDRAHLELKNLFNFIGSDTVREVISPWLGLVFKNQAKSIFEYVYTERTHVALEDERKKLRSGLIIEATKVAKEAALAAQAEGAKVDENQTVKDLLALLESPWGFDLLENFTSNSVDKNILAIMVELFIGIDWDDLKKEASIKLIRDKIRAKTDAAAKLWDEFAQDAYDIAKHTLAQRPDILVLTAYKEVQELLNITYVPSTLEDVLAAADKLVKDGNSASPFDFVYRSQDFVEKDHSKAIILLESFYDNGTGKFLGLILKADLKARVYEEIMRLFNLLSDGEKNRIINEVSDGKLYPLEILTSSRSTKDESLEALLEYLMPYINPRNLSPEALERAIIVIDRCSKTAMQKLWINLISENGNGSGRYSSTKWWQWIKYSVNKLNDPSLDQDARERVGQGFRALYAKLDNYNKGKNFLGPRSLKFAYVDGHDPAESFQNLINVLKAKYLDKIALLERFDMGIINQAYSSISVYAIFETIAAHRMSQIASTGLNAALIVLNSRLQQRDQKGAWEDLQAFTDDNGNKLSNISEEISNSLYNTLNSSIISQREIQDLVGVLKPIITNEDGYPRNWDDLLRAGDNGLRQDLTIGLLIELIAKTAPANGGPATGGNAANDKGYLNYDDTPITN